MAYVVRLDGGRGALVRDRLDDVGVEGTLEQEIGVLDRAGLLLKDLNEGVANDLALALGVGDLHHR